MAITLTQFFLYIPNFSCTGSASLPFCAEQFSFSIIESSSITKNFIGSIKEFLRLVSFLAIDMGWSNTLSDPDIYKEDNLVDTFDSENVYQVNYFGYCKKKNNKRLYCAPSGNNGMDVLGILVRDIGIQLCMLSAPRQNDTKVLGDSLVLTYHLALSSLRKILKDGQGNVFSKILLRGDDVSSKGRSKTSRYNKGVEVAYSLEIANRAMLFLQACEVLVSFACALIVIGFGIVLTLGKKHRLFPILLQLGTSSLVSLATVSLIGTILYYLALKSLEPSNDLRQQGTGWEMMQVTIGTGFIIGCIRYGVQVTLLPLTWIISKRYSSKKVIVQDSADTVSSDDASKHAV